MNYLLIPRRLRFKPDNMRHPSGVVAAIEGSYMTKDLTGTVKAVVEESEVVARQVARAALSDYLKPVLKSYPSLKLSDFELVYACDTIKDGRVWASGHVIQTLTL